MLTLALIGPSLASMALEEILKVYLQQFGTEQPVFEVKEEEKKPITLF